MIFIYQSFCWSSKALSPIKRVAYLKIILPFLALILAAVIANKITSSQPPATRGNAQAVSALLVDIQTIETQTFQPVVESFGVLEANARTRIFPLVSGQVIALDKDFEAGAYVKEGQTLLRIDSIEYEVSLQVARSDLANAELALAEEQARFDQAKSDWSKSKPRAGSLGSDFALRRPQLKAAKANLETAKARLRLAERNLNRTRVTAPYSGRLIETSVNIGSVVNASTQLAELYSDESLQLSLAIASRDLAFIKLPESGLPTLKPTEVILQSTLGHSDELWLGEIVGTEALIDADNQQLYAVVEIIGPQSSEGLQRESEHPLNNLKVGEYLRANIMGQTLEKVITVPNSAIYQGTYVYLVESKDGEELIRRQAVSVKWRNAEVSLIESGLEPGQRLVTTLLGQVTSGTKVRINQGDRP